jgi:phosphate transport system permease protein
MNNITFNRWVDKSFKYFGICCTFFGVALLLIFISNIISDGIARIDWEFLTALPSRKAEKAGILTAWTGTTWILGLTAIIAIPLGVAAGIYLQEYGSKNRFASFIELNITNLAGVPSIIYGLLV